MMKIKMWGCVGEFYNVSFLVVDMEIDKVVDEVNLVVIRVGHTVA